MQLRLIREPSLDDATLGVLFVDGHFHCFTLEDSIRERPDRPVADWKIPGATAIPAGRYRLAMTPSVRFKRTLPLLLDVPGFSGCRIHAGNTTADTEGCVLVGRDRGRARVQQSRVALESLCDALSADDEAWITIENP